MIPGLDHVVALVADLDAAVAQYRDHGFTVAYGGSFPDGTHNALITLRDGSYLELLGFRELVAGDDPLRSQMAGGGGWIEFGLATADLDEEVAAISARGLRYADPHVLTSDRSDGTTATFRIAFPEEGAYKSLPFAMADTGSRAPRAAGEAAQHANGVVGIDRLIVAVDDLDATAAHYAALLGAAPVTEKAEPFDEPADTAVFRTGDHRIELHRPRGGGPMSNRIKQRGAGPYAVVLRGSADCDFRPDETAGARLRINQAVEVSTGPGREEG